MYISFSFHFHSCYIVHFYDVWLIKRVLFFWILSWGGFKTGNYLLGLELPIQGRIWTFYTNFIRSFIISAPQKSFFFFCNIGHLIVKYNNYKNMFTKQKYKSIILHTIFWYKSVVTSATRLYKFWPRPTSNTCSPPPK